ncbi:isoleucyl-tRNA synthetase [Saprolegnia diclina VS20]|uniref:isoleucine--tRNA ligase n=2 Tax=Saprolegnia diclina (strain VS20) TaxID=1156394 RepID=T0R005_SAPDV|nr:isoleucyl-tRNA synthetase [Saprolegnia diclina VS20]EQC39640.1 isoleucyl-tRNA synthetase [Saprolegnia diclina VS20]|eukprot:XP_008606912.1 isoleucyl-tRNA synthetase [Saprolegnia diclina VS20]
MTKPSPHADVRLPERLSFPDQELATLELWKELDAFMTSLRLSKDRKPFTFYDGPPFATGLPHHGHILAGTIKDIVTRFAHQTGHYVERRFGWDCHGLPIEYEINKKLNVHTKEDVLAMGIAAYNNECRGIVQRYTKEWESTVTRLGRWIDCKNDYKTMEPWFMESVWNVFQTMFNKDLVYRGFKILPYSTACNTSLSNFEANSDYRDTPDPSVVINFPLVTDANTYLLIWTTTPWTLPSNLAVCVNPELDYVKVKDLKSGKFYIVAESRLVQVYPKLEKKGYVAGSEFEKVESLKGAALVGLAYVPLFDTFASWPNAFHVIGDSYVSSDNGTGLVHQSPTYGEEDYRVCLANGIVDKITLPDPLDDNGKFTSQVPLVAGLHVKEADDVLLKDLKDRGRLVSKSTFVHSYPFCYRSGTPLIYRAVPGWFINVEKIKDKIIANNQKTYWVPAFVKEKRFHNWLVDGKDWNVSRNRFWGTPLPLWVSDDFEEVVCIGSIEELKQKSGVQDITDLHREFIDEITIPSSMGKGVLRRVTEVFDCWFESGSMPYAQQHYPFENKEKFMKGFPADFIAEGLDQTRGWFYTLMVIGTALFDQPPFKNLIVNGLVLAEDGRKMSKSLRNYPDPNDILSKYGADALRLYLINSPVVRAEPLRFQEAGVMGIIRDVFLPWYNAARFFVQQVARLEEASGETFVPTSLADDSVVLSNTMDAWIVAALHSLVQFVKTEMAAYRLYTVVPRLIEFVDQLTKWHVRLNRNRLKGAEGHEAAHIALSALFDVLYTLCKLMAPFTPFFTEYMYQFLKLYHPVAHMAKTTTTPVEDADGVAKSVHYLMIPDFDPKRLNAEAEARMAKLQQVIEMGRVVRERRAISLKNPVKSVIVVTSDASVRTSLESVKSYIHDELNMRDLVFAADEKEWCSLKVEVNNKVVGKRLGKQLGAVKKIVEALSHDDALSYQRTQRITLTNGVELSGDDLFVKREFKGDKKIYEADVSVDGALMVVIDVREDDLLKSQGVAREFVNRVQKMRKKAGLVVADKIHVYFKESAASTVITKAIETFVGSVAGTLGTTPAPGALQPSEAVVIVSEVCEFANSSVEIVVVRPAVLFATPDATSSAQVFVATMDYAKARDALVGAGHLNVAVPAPATLTLNKDVFLDAKDKVAYTESLRASLGWMLTK